MNLMFQTVLATLLEVIVPLSVPVAAGALLKRFTKMDTKPFTTFFLYFLTPALILDTLTNADISYGDVVTTAAFSLLNLALLWGIALAFGKLLKLPAPEQAGVTLAATLTNSVNYGLPLVLLALGKLGLDKASVYVILQMILVNTIGVYMAARSQFSIKNAVKSVFSLPAIYAAMLAVGLQAFDLNLPSGVQTGVAMVAGAYAPVVLAILGAQMVGVNNAGADRNVRAGVWAGIAIRLLLSPFVAWLCLYLLKVEGVLYAVLFILSCMPVAVNAVVLSERFNASPKLVSKCILWTTLASFLVLPVIIVYVK